jgi:hypothetical protein
MARYGHKKITWKDDAKRVSPPQTVPKLVREYPLDGQPYDLHPGDMFLTVTNLEVWEDHPSVKSHALRYIIETWMTPQHVQPGSPTKIISKDSIATYAGTARVEEMDGRGNVVSRLRHTFIINSTRYMTNNLNNFKQV